MIDVAEMKRRLEEIGVARVRERLADNVYGAKERPIVEEWLASKEKVTSNKITKEQLRIAKSAQLAAWAAAIAAIISALAAIFAWLWR